jgi:hypothetical protein
MRWPQFFIAILLVLLAVHPHAAFARGELVKGSLSAVYYLAEDGTRFVFPNEKIFFSWYPDFSGVTQISDDALAQYPIGGNVTYRPGTRLIKLVSDPRVYAVESGGVLRWVGSESVAQTLWGSEWTQRVDDLPDGFFPAYAIGASLTDARYPDGTLLQDRTTGAFYVVWNGERREVTSEGLAANGWQEAFAIPADTSDMRDGPILWAEDADFSDTAQLNRGKNQATGVVGSVGTLSGTILQGEDDQTLGVFTISLREQTDVSDPSIRLEAHTNQDTDTDLGGLVRGVEGQSSTAAFSSIRIVDEDGTLLFGSANLATQNSGDGAQTLTLPGARTFTPGRHTLRVIANVAEDTPQDERYGAIWDLAATAFEQRGRTTDVWPTEIEGDEVTVKEPGLELALSGESKSVSVLRGAPETEAVAFDLTNQLDEIVSIDALTLTGYVDEGEGDPDFVAGADQDDGGPLLLSSLVDRVSVYRDGAFVASSSDIGSDGSVRFQNLGWRMSSGQSWRLSMRATVNASAPFGVENDRFAFDLSRDDAFDASVGSGEEVNVIGSSPNGASAPIVYVTVAKSGSLTVEGSGGGEAVMAMGTRDYFVYALTFSADETEDIVIDQLAVRLNDGDAARSVSSGELQFVSDGVAHSVDANVVSGALTFRDVGLLVPKDEAGDQEIDANVYIDVAGSSQGAVSGDEIGFTFEPSTFEAHGVTSGFAFTRDDFGDRISDETEAGINSIVRRSVVAVSGSAQQVDTSADRNGEAPVMRFKLSALGEASARVHRITFEIDPSDVGTEVNDVSADNDALEYWADVDGDASDDNNVAELVDESGGDTVGEGSSGHIDYAIFVDADNTIDTTPQGRDSARGDLGILAYEFVDPLVVTGSGMEFTLYLDTTGFAHGGQSVRVKILGGEDFIWGDGTLAGDDLPGDGISGLPYTGPNIGID